MSVLGFNITSDMPFGKAMKLSAIYGLCWGFGMGVGVTLIVLIFAWLGKLPKL
jgi:hypothetical protein